MRGMPIISTAMHQGDGDKQECSPSNDKVGKAVEERRPLGLDAGRAQRQNRQQCRQERHGVHKRA